jgi:hypothetical protein
MYDEVLSQYHSEKFNFLIDYYRRIVAINFLNVKCEKADTEYVEDN